MGLRSDRVPMEELGVKSENIDILLASDHLEFARELEQFKGGFFTSSICSAITADFDDVDLNGDGALSVEEVSSWLERCADNHNRKHRNWQVHMPRRLGFGHGKTFLTLPPDAWFIHEFLLPDGEPAVVLPVRPMGFDPANRLRGRDGDWRRAGAGDLAIALGRNPVTNRAYSRFVKAWHHAPSGKRYDLERGWIGPFSPWKDPKFSDPDQPVVCVTQADVLSYCQWLEKQAGNRLIGPPTSAMWDVAGFGTSNPDRLNPRVWLSTCAQIHHKSAAPQICKDALARTNSRGYTDIIGNVWEWCGRLEAWGDVFIPNFFDTQALGPRPPVLDQLRGGGFLDDLERVTPFINVSELPDKENTSHADLGFRVAVLLRIEELPTEIIERVMRCKPLYHFASLTRPFR